MPDINDLYPKPPQPTQGLASNPLAVIDLVGKLNQNALFQQQFNAHKAIGRAYQKAIRQDGSIDTQTLMQEIQRNPDAGYLAGEASAGALARQGQQITNAAAATELQMKQQRFVADAIGSIDPNTPKSAVIDRLVALKRNIPSLPSAMIANTIQDINKIDDKTPEGKAALTAKIGQLRDFAIGATGLATPTEGGVNPSTGTNTKIPLGGFLRQGGAQTTLPPGEPEVMAQSAARASKLQSTASTTAQYHADLDNLKQESKVLDNLGGPTTETEKKLNQLSQRVAGVGVTMDKEQLKALESFDKIANQISLNQSQFFHGSDAGLHTVVGANPSTSMSRYGRDGVIDMLQGNQDAIDVTRKAWLKARRDGAPAHSYDTFVDQFSQTLDPRVFQFNRLSRDNQQKFLSQMDPGDMADFEQKYKAAIDNKWVKPLKAAPNG